MYRPQDQARSQISLLLMSEHIRRGRSVLILDTKISKTEVEQRVKKLLSNTSRRHHDKA
jgi:hypothetical protein